MLGSLSTSRKKARSASGLGLLITQCAPMSIGGPPLEAIAGPVASRCRLPAPRRAQSAARRNPRDSRRSWDSDQQAGVGEIRRHRGRGMPGDDVVAAVFIQPRWLVVFTPDTPLHIEGAIANAAIIPVKSSGVRSRSFELLQLIDVTPSPPR